MPKLQERDVERNQVKIEEAALRVFTRQGFHGTSVREIASEAGVSLGNIYTYYPTKEELFRRLVERYDRRMAQVMKQTLGALLGSLDPTDLHRLAQAVREIVYGNPDYWRLMYIDVVEFGNRHFAHIFDGLARKLEKLSGGYRNSHKLTKDIDPSLAFAAIYLQFFTYFLVEKLFRGKQHLGMSDDRAIAQLIRIFTSGVSGGAHGQTKGSTQTAPRNGARRRK
ncbi:MAG: TetR/AcrR family transcriptional regulator [Terriglobales bacterium]